MSVVINCRIGGYAGFHLNQMVPVVNDTSLLNFQIQMTQETVSSFTDEKMFEQNEMPPFYK
jgi:hypothetical protein